MFLRIVLGLGFTAGVVAAESADGIKVLERVARTYRGAQTLSIEATIVLEAGANGMKLELPMTAARRAAEARIEVSNPMMSTQTVSDGKHVWKYADRLRQYTKRPASADLGEAAQGPGQILAGESVLSGLKVATLVRSERVMVGGSAMECDVIEAVYVGDGLDSPVTYWVDRRRHLIVRIRRPLEAPGSAPMTQTIAVSSIQVGQPLREGMFVFVAPAGASEVAEFAASRASRQD
jgi:outer membrane lipoprotein-sorting protein